MEDALNECEEVGGVKFEILAKIFSATHIVASKRIFGFTAIENK